MCGVGIAASGGRATITAFDRRRRAATCVPTPPAWLGSTWRTTAASTGSIRSSTGFGYTPMTSDQRDERRHDARTSRSVRSGRRRCSSWTGPWNIRWYAHSM